MNKFLFFLLLSVKFAFSQTAVIPIEELRNKLKLAQLEIKGTNTFQAAKISGITIQLPMPDGSQSSYYILENQVMSPELAKQYPDIKTYQIFNTNGKSDESGTLTLSPFGLNGYVFTNKGNVIISPKDYKINLHQVIFEKDNPMVDETCGVKDEIHSIADLNKKKLKENGINTYSNGGTLRTYKMVIASNGEFYAANGNSVGAVQAAIVSIVNSLKSIYEKEVAISFTLFATKIYDNSATDPFDPTAGNLADQAANVFGALAVAEPGSFGLGLWNIGHVLHGASGGGVAYTPSTCNNNVQPPMTGPLKGGGWSGSNPTSFSTFIHEVGHQFSAGHTFNSVSSGCNGNIMTGSAYEPGSGSTFMSYWGNCSPDNISGPINRVHFNTNSLQSIINFSTNSGTCSSNTSTGNAVPVANAGSAYTIPKNTPFILTGSGTDANGDILYYNWEQYNLGTTRGSAAAAAGSTDSPIFRSFEPTTTGNTRSFPSLAAVLNGSLPSNDEALPTVGRSLLFRLTARDRRAGGSGVHCSEVSITVDPNSGPLTITAPNGGGTIAANTSQTINWIVNNTNTLSANVNILLSIDGGSTFPFALVRNTPNDGNQIVTIPINVPATLQARVKVVSNNSLTAEFYDLSNGDFSISNGNCQVVNTLICPTNTITNVSGNAAFNLELGNTLVKKMIGNTKTFSTVNLGSFPVINYSNNNYSTCQISGWGQENAVLLPFRVSQTGSFTISSTGDNGALSMVWSLFSSNTFNCANLINGNSFGAISWTSNRTITLNECTTYYLLLYNISNPNTANNITINIQGVGNIYEIITSPSGVGYTYAAVNQFNNQISAFSNSSNFTNLSGGTYSVYGLQYVNSVNISSLVGNTLEQVYSSANCVLFSENSKILVIIGNPCPATRDFTNPANNISTGTIVHKANQTITATNSITGGDVTLQAGNKIELNPGFQVSNGAVFRSILVAGCI